MHFQGYGGWYVLAALAFSKDGLTKYQVAEIVGFKQESCHSRLAEARASGLVARRRHPLSVSRWQPHLWSLTEPGIRTLQSRLGIGSSA